MKPKAQVEYRAIAELKELPGNPRTIKKDQFEKLKQSIKDNADYFEARPIILSDRTGEQLNRICYMMELDPHYADVIIERWEKFTGQKAVRIKEAA